MILITRPKEQGMQTHEKLKSLGFNSRILPLLEILKLDSPSIIDHKYTAAIITSQHAAIVANQISWLKEKPTYVVGSKTAKSLIDFDLKFVAKDNNDLLKYLKLNLGIKEKILYICGDHVAGEFDKKLIKHGYNITKSIVYKSVAIKDILPKDLEGIEYIFFYSPRTAQIFSETFKGDCSSITAICISSNTANELVAKKFKSIKIPSSPNEDSMIQLLNK